MKSRQMQDAHLALTQAVHYFGTQARMASALSESQQTVSYWVRAGRAPERACIPIERATEGAVTRYALRPDVFGKPYSAWTALRRIFRFGLNDGKR
ncbi:MAG: Cro/CI family transcriptional regulator [Nannocystaceae bacterium]